MWAETPFDRQKVITLGSYMYRLKMYPVFHICHCVLTISSLRHDLSHGQDCIARKHPLACWLSSVLSCFAGSIVSSALLGESVLAQFQNNGAVVIASVVWYLVFYSPFDLFDRLCGFRVVKICLASMKEIQRVRKINDGVLHVAGLYPQAYLLMVIIGVVKGCGGLFCTFVCRFLCGMGIENNHELAQPSLTTKANIIMAALFVLQRYHVLHVDKFIMSVAMVAVMILLKLLSIFHLTSPLTTVDRLAIDILFGNWSDALNRARRKAVWKDQNDSRSMMERARSVESETSSDRKDRKRD